MRTAMTQQSQTFSFTVIVLENKYLENYVYSLHWKKKNQNNTNMKTDLGI